MDFIIPHLNKYLATKHPYLGDLKDKTFTEITQIIDLYLSKLTPHPKHPFNNIIDLFRQIPGNFSEFFNLQKDLPGLNHIVRHGLIKEVTIHDKKFIIKKENPSKPGRFEKEQQNIEKVADKISLTPPIKDAAGHTIKLQSLNYLGSIIDHTHNFQYSITQHQPGPTLEELLLKESHPQSRQTLLQHVRLIFDTLSELGIYWGDMAPRNIIVDESTDLTTYYLFDFEKTDIYDAPLTTEQKINLCRGPMCVEEFGAICELTELTSTFSPYFNPDSWDTESKKAISVSSPKRELMTIFKHHNINHITEGSYNLLEQEIINVRLPLTHPDTKEKYFPLNINFKIDHYFGPEYDRQVTELFLYARKHNFFPDTINILNTLLQEYEHQIEIDSLISRLEQTPYNSFSANKIRHKIQTLITHLSLATKSLPKFIETISFLSYITSTDKLHYDLLITNPLNIDLISKLSAIKNHFTDPLTILLIGSTSKNNHKPSSDLDIIILDHQKTHSREIQLIQDSEKLSQIINKPIELCHYLTPSQFFEQAKRKPEFLAQIHHNIVIKDDQNLQTLISRHLTTTQ
ncbi:hypothetical protein CVV38_00550 [Candidatus Peregrinibacteria bacterium HGW-Peregrinibacteria-1]|jgi:predicted nucleotidyltransferase|nr:MAG: hypothetical protein CVV38_00550 [Candidatus Peregrinibacteria bacterium HGW-Peregrinibacteria-1]